MKTRYSIFIIAFTFILFNLAISSSLVKVVGLGNIAYENQVQGIDVLDTEKLNFEIVKNNIASVLKSNNVQFKVKSSQIQTNWYEYNKQACKMYITIMADLCEVRVQFQQKDLNGEKYKKIDPYKIKGDIKKRLSQHK